MRSHPVGGSRKPAEWAEARRLRRDHGMPLKAIASELGVSLSSVSIWTRDIVISPHQHERNQRVATVARASSWANRNRMRRVEYQDAGRERARQGDSDHQAGCMLYWAEGSKSRNSFAFTNSDVDMVRFMRRFLTEVIDVAVRDVRLRLNVYIDNGLSLREVERHWLTALDLPRSCLDSHTVNHHPTSSSGRRRNKLPYGVATLRTHSTRVIQHIYGAIQEYVGIDRPEWLD